jgi:hypothetical protein
MFRKGGTAKLAASEEVNQREGKLTVVEHGKQSITPILLTIFTTPNTTTSPRFTTTN